MYDNNITDQTIQGINQKYVQMDLQEINILLTKIKKDSKDLQKIFWNQEELNDIQNALDFFEARIQNMIDTTLKNLEWYQNEGWKKFVE